MTRYIDAKICIEKIKNLSIEYDAETVQRCIEVVSNAPTIDAPTEQGNITTERLDTPTIDTEPVRHGKWIKADSQQYFRKHYPCFTCSECGYRKDSQKTWNYCPHCGAYMKGTEDDKTN